MDKSDKEVRMSNPFEQFSDNRIRDIPPTEGEVSETQEEEEPPVTATDDKVAGLVQDLRKAASSVGLHIGV